MKYFFYKASFVSFVLLNADFGKNTQKILAHKAFTQKGEFMYGRVKPGCFTDKWHKSMMKSFSLKWVLFPMYFYTLILGKILQKFWHVQCLHKMENLCMERVKPGRFFYK